MIDDIATVIEAISPTVDGRVYRKWPQTRTQTPYAIVDRVGRSVTQADADGSEVVVSIAYSVDILGDSPSQLDTIQSDITDALASYSIHATGESPLWESTNQTYRRSLTFQGSMDRRGNTFL